MTLHDETLAAVVAEIPTWQISVKDGAENYQPPMTPEQVEWFNRGVLATGQMVEEMRKGNL